LDSHHFDVRDNATSSHGPTLWKIKDHSATELLIELLRDQLIASVLQESERKVRRTSTISAPGKWAALLLA
jgi:hypothetical protein